MRVNLRRTRNISLVLTMAAICVIATPAFAEGSASHGGRLRLELQGINALSEDHSNRNGDVFYTGSVEYEMPVGNRYSVGLRLYPLFIYPGHGHTNYGAAAGIATRVYQHQGVRNGLYGELGCAPLVTRHMFRHNSSAVNFLDEIGVGYQFPESHWHVALKFEHISNAGLGRENRGVNAVGLGFGYTF